MSRFLSFIRLQASVFALGYMLSAWYGINLSHWFYFIKALLTA